MSFIAEFDSIEELHTDDQQLKRLTAAIHARKVCLIRRVLEPDFCRSLVDYLANVGRNSLPNRVPTLPSCPNHHRAYQWDELSFVKGCFHQFSFFPWNEDIFELFKRFAPIYRLRNICSGLPPEKFVGKTPDDDCIARISFQFYPAGAGAMNRHTDPVDVHQKAVPILLLSKKGKDYQEGGLYYEMQDGTKIFADEIGDPGDLVLTLAEIPHGVEKIDPEVKINWQSFQGRWSGVVAVNKMVTNTTIGNAVDLEKSRRSIA